MRKFSRFLLLFIVLSTFFFLSTGKKDSPSLYAQENGAPATGAPATEPKPYPSQGVSAGVWNNGYASLWDFPLIDHFAVFGPKERVRGFMPDQPINFSHVIHVQQNQIECQYCHWSVAKAAFAAIPEVQACMGCHKWVAGKTEEGKKDVLKLKEYFDAGKPIPWIKVHVMPDHVKFNHKRHVKAGVSCQECHGQIPEMAKVQRVSSLKMGWCIDCHRERGTSIDCWTCHK